VGFVGCCSASRLPRLETRDGSEAARAGPTPLTCIPRITKASKPIFCEGKCCVLGRVYFICNYRPDSRVWRGTAARSRQPWLPRTNGGEFIPFVGRARPPPLLPTHRLSERRKSAKHQSKKAHPVVRRFLAMNCGSKDHPGSSWESNVVVGPLPQSLTSIPFLDKYK